jgi:hypothetical protein
MPGTLIEAAGQQQICGLIVECGNHLSKQVANTALDHVLAILIHYHLMDASISSIVKPTDTDAGFLGIKNLIDTKGLR